MFRKEKIRLADNNKQMSNLEIVKQLNIIGAAVIILMVGLVFLEIFDFTFFLTIQDKYITSNDKVFFNHLKRLFIIGIFFAYSVFHFCYIFKKYPTLSTRMNRRILIIIQILIIVFITLIAIRIYFLFSTDFSYSRVKTFSEFSQQRGKNFNVLKNPAEENYNIDYVVIKSELVDFFLAEQKYNTTEVGYCLYGYKLIPAGQSRRETDNDTIVIEGAMKVGAITTTENMLLFNPCPSEVLHSDLTQIFHFDHPGHQNLETDTSLFLVGLIHNHPSRPQNNIFQLHPPECELSHHDVFTFAQENLGKRAWIWGVVCSQEKLFFYSTNSINVPIKIVIID